MLGISEGIIDEVSLTLHINHPDVCYILILSTHKSIPKFIFKFNHNTRITQILNADAVRTIRHDSARTKTMYTTIEPRLIALLSNDTPSESFTTSPSLELPPLHDPNILKASGRPLLLEPDASKRNGKPTTNSQLVPQHTTPIASIDEDGTHESGESKKTGKQAADRALGSSSPQSLRKILDDDTGHAAAAVPSSKKRNIVENSKDDFVQLPQPPKKQKAAKQVVPPIIIGLFEPPPQAALFPPIASSSFHDSHGRNSLNTVALKVKESKDNPRLVDSPNEEKQQTTSNGDKKKDVRARKKWTEEETNNLLFGVSKHGVGKWTDILEDPSFSFNDRSGVDLKDRFRTCCPVEYRGKAPKPRHSVLRPEKSSIKGKGKLRSSLMSENILIEDDEVGINMICNANDTSNRSRKNRAHRKRLEDLAQLGIEGPFRKSQRRERRPFSDDDDCEILAGYLQYGPAWTRIQRDPRFHLQSRQPTDLRDRFRNKYPERFRSEDISKDTQKIDGAGEDTAKTNGSHSSSSFQRMDSREKENSMVAGAQSSSNFQRMDGLEKDNGTGTHVPSSHQKMDGREKEIANSTMTTSLPSLNLQAPSSRDGLRIQQIISSDHGKPQGSLFGFKDMFTPFSEHSGSMESTDGLPFSQSFDWNRAITAPFLGNMGEMDISRLLLDENWIENPSCKEKQTFTDINSIITSSANAIPNGQPFYNMLDPEQIVNLQSAATLDHDGSFG